MRKLREVAHLVRRASAAGRNAEAIEAIRRRIWCGLEPSGDDGFVVICRAKDVADVVADRESTDVRGNRWRVELGETTYRINSWTLVDAEKPRQFIGLKIGSNQAGGNQPPFSSQAV